MLKVKINQKKYLCLKSIFSISKKSAQSRVTYLRETLNKKSSNVTSLKTISVEKNSRKNNIQESFDNSHHLNYIKEFLALFISFILILHPLLADGFTPSQPSHGTLYSDTITSKTDASPVNVADAQGLFVTGDVTTLGNVGIGTAAPNGKLEISGTTAAAPLLLTSAQPTLVLRRTTADGTSSGVIDFQTSINAVKWRIGSQQMVGGSNLEINEGDNVNNRLTILTGGNIGIGTITPAQKLEVAGTVQMTGFKMAGGAAGQVLTSDASGVGTWQAASGGSLPPGILGQTLRHDGTNWVSSSLLQNLGADNIKVQNNNEVYVDIQNTEASGREYALVSAGSLGAIGVGKFSIYDKTAGISRLSVDSAGNIGVGTTTPGAKLDVIGGAIRGDTGLTISAGTVSLPSGQIDNSEIANPSVTVSAGTGLSGGGAVSLGASTSLSLNTANVNTWTGAQTYSANTMFPGSGIWNSAGSVGIGTTTPAQKLEVAGTVQMTGFKMAGGAAGQVLTSDASGVGTWQGGGGVSGSGTLNKVAKWTVTGSALGDSQIFDDGTSVGIGTTTPGTKVDVVGGTIRGNSGLTISAGTVSLPSGQIDNSEIANPSVTVSAGTGLTGGGSIALGASTSLSLDTTSSNTWTGAQTYSANTMFPGSGIWNSAGSVGIGTTTPAQKLEVAGGNGRIRLKKTSGVAGSVDLFVAITSGSTGTASCQAIIVNAVCLQGFTSAGATATCASTTVGNRILCVGFGD